MLGGFLEARAYWDEAISAHTLAVQAGRDLVNAARVARASLELSEVLQQTGQHDTALPLAEEAADIYRSLADRRGEAEALDQIGLAHQRAGPGIRWPISPKPGPVTATPQTRTAWPTR